MTDVSPLPSALTKILSDADKKIHGLTLTSHHLLYQFVRLTITKIAPATDSFYIGFFVESNKIIFPYSYDGTEYDSPDKHDFAKDGLTAWIKAEKRPYQFCMDYGKLLSKGRKFGDESRRSADAVVVPLLERKGSRKGRVIGLAGILSYSPYVYDLDTIRAFQWLAESVTRSILLELESAVRRRDLNAEETVSDETRPGVVVGDAVSIRLRAVRDKLDALERLIPADHIPLIEAAHELRRECEKAQTETIELQMRSLLAHRSRLESLTERQRQVFDLIVQGYSDRQIAGELGIAVNTAKNHVKAVLEHFSVKQRAGVSEIAKHIIS